MKLRGDDRATRRGPARRLAFALLLLFPAASSRAADLLVLRNLKVISDRTVLGFDADGVRLDDGATVGWGEIEKGTVGAGRQTEFDRWLSELSEPLYRIRQRLSVGDDRGLLPHAEAVYPRYADRDSPTAYMVSQALMWGRLAAGKREGALEPYLRCLGYLRRHGAASVSLPGKRRLKHDSRTGLCPELPPVWFDGEAAKAALPGVFRAVGRIPLPRPEGVYIYYATLAFAAGDGKAGEKGLSAMQSADADLAELRQIAFAQWEITSRQPGDAVRRLSTAWRGFNAANKPLAVYWLGLSAVRATEPRARQQGVLLLLQIPALYGQEQPELAGAALYHSSKALAELQDVRASVTLRKELLEKYGRTYYASRVGPTPRAAAGVEEKS